MALPFELTFKETAVESKLKISEVISMYFLFSTAFNSFRLCKLALMLSGKKSGLIVLITYSVGLR